MFVKKKTKTQNYNDVCQKKTKTQNYNDVCQKKTKTQNYNDVGVRKRKTKFDCLEIIFNKDKHVFNTTRTTKTTCCFKQCGLFVDKIVVFGENDPVRNFTSRPLETFLSPTFGHRGFHAPEELF